MRHATRTPARGTRGRTELGQLGGGEMKLFKCEAQGDVLYFNSDTQQGAYNKLCDLLGEEVPESLITWTEIEALPEGEEAL